MQAQCRGHSMQEFLSEFSLRDLVANDHEAGHHIQAQLPPSVETDIVDGAVNSDKEEGKWLPWQLCLPGF